MYYRKNNIRFIDSLSFFLCPLSKLSETFNIDTVKGYFPHKFNIPENQNYIGKIPDEKYYGSNNMKPEDKVKFDKWYSENKEITNWNFQEEFNKYCIVRLPVVYGNELKKNIIYDLINKNQINNINPNDLLQYYPVNKLYLDINFSIKNNLSLVNLSSKPIKSSKIIRIFYKKNIIHKKKKIRRNYNMKTIYSKLWSKKDYIYTEKYIIDDLTKFRNTYLKK
jgi:hypothetical protein